MIKGKHKTAGINRVPPGRILSYADTTTMPENSAGVNVQVELNTN